MSIIDSDKDDEEEQPAPKSTQKNYITPNGLKKIQEELRHLKTKERPEITAIVTWAAENGDRSENADYKYGKQRLREIDKRIRFLAKRLDNVEIVDPTKVNSNQILFGATVTIRDEDDNEKTYSIVGIDETDAAKGRISWISPLAKALFKAKEGDWVEFKSPKGVREIEVVKINYIQID